MSAMILGVKANHPAGPTLREAAETNAKSQSWGCDVVDFAMDPRWHTCFFGQPTEKDIKDLRAFLRQDPERMVRLYHGTSADLPIMEEGLLPTSSTRRHSLASSSGYVYLSVFPGSAEDFGRMGAPGKATQVYAVVVPVRRLLADHDQLRQRRYWGGGYFNSIGATLADSLVFGHGARVKGAVDPRLLTPLKLIWSAHEAYPWTDDWVGRAKKFILEKWQERAVERKAKMPEDLSGACKFASLFAARVFGGELVGNSNHQFVRLHGEILDLTDGASSFAEWRQKGINPYRHDQEFWGNPEHLASMESCLPRVDGWVSAWREAHPLDERLPSGLRRASRK